MAEQINFYAVLRAVPRSFKPVYGITNLYLYINIHRDSGWRSDTVFGCFLCKTHPCNGLCFAQFHAKIHNIKKKQTRKGSFWGEYTNFLTKGWLWEFFSWCYYNKCSFHNISLKRATILLPKIIFFLIFIQLMDEVMIIFKAKLSDNLTLFFPGGAKFWLQNVQNSFSERGRCPLSTPTRALPLDPAGA